MIKTKQDILTALQTSGGWKVQEFANDRILSAQWRRRIVTIKFREDGRIDKLFLRYPMPFNAGITREEITGTAKKQAALRFIRGEKTHA